MGIKGSAASSWVLLFVPIPFSFVISLILSKIIKHWHHHIGAASYVVLVGFLTSIVVWGVSIGLFYWAKHIDCPNNENNAKAFLEFAAAALAPALACFIPFIFFAMIKGATHAVFNLPGDVVKKFASKIKAGKASKAAGEGEEAGKVGSKAAGEAGEAGTEAAEVGAEATAEVGTDVAADAALGPVGLAIAAAQLMDAGTSHFPFLLIFKPAITSTIFVLFIMFFTSWGITDTVCKDTEPPK